MPDRQRLLSGDLSPRLAAIDIGTNSMRLVVAEARRGDYRTLDEERVSTRLGRGLQETGRLDPGAVAESLEALRRFRKIAESFEPRQIRTIATCAVREAENGEEFCRRAREEVGLEVEVISAADEARLAFFSVRQRFELSDKKFVVGDIGGGSTELVFASGNQIEAIYATPLGAVRLADMFGGGQSLAGNDFFNMQQWIDEHLKKQFKKPIFFPHLLIGSGGTFTSLAAMVMAQKSQTGLPLRGYHVSRAAVTHLVDRLRKMSPRQRRDVGGLSADRADIIVPGLAIIERLMRRLKVNTLQVHNAGVRDGLLLQMLQTDDQTSGHKVEMDAAIDQFASACGADLEHSRHVARLAGELFDQLCQPLRLEPEDRKLLTWAARLQDVGYLINYDKHHKHSYHLILNSPLQGIRPTQLEIVANVARYHRGSQPKKGHANFKQLSKPDQQRVRQLSGILRLAGGLDRSHVHQVTGLQVQVSDEEVEILVDAPQYPDVDIWGARRRAGLFEKAFQRSVAIHWAGDRAEQPVL